MNRNRFLIRHNTFDLFQSDRNNLYFYIFHIFDLELNFYILINYQYEIINLNQKYILVFILLLKMINSEC